MERNKSGLQKSQLTNHSRISTSSIFSDKLSKTMSNTIIVQNLGYLNLKPVQEMLQNKVRFGIYYTTKKTMILVKFSEWQKEICDKIWLYYPKRDKLPYKLVEGKKITFGSIVFNSEIDKSIDTTGWNNGNQIMTYEEFTN